MSNSKKLIQLGNLCFLCEDGYNFASPSSLKNHYRSVHNIDLPSRSINDRRPSSKKYDYTLEDGHDVPVHYTCISCFYHTNSTRLIKRHIENEHLYGEQIKEEDGEDEEDEEDEEVEEASDKKSQSSRSSKQSNKEPAETVAKEAMKILVAAFTKMMK
ncbi:hypothetical protein BY458DRAFT_492885 [Sporodiniella umbellata]|nr:hypothetical protein BY458DRAFT_492885 [Sporodiniella umbellata]